MRNMKLWEIFMFIDVPKLGYLNLKKKLSNLQANKV